VYGCAGAVHAEASAAGRGRGLCSGGLHHPAGRASCTTLPEFFDCRVQPVVVVDANTTRLSCLPTWFGRSPGYSLGTES